jgi:N utilization substance protein A
MSKVMQDVQVVILKKYGSADNNIIVNPTKGDLEIWRNRIVVDDSLRNLMIMSIYYLVR